MPNQLKRDPTRTTTLRKRFAADMRRRFKSVDKANKKLIVDEDVFGLKTGSSLLTMQERQAWRFRTDANKVKEYRKWLKQQVDAKILTTDAISGQPWTGTYVESAYKKGAVHAYAETRALDAVDEPATFLGGKAEFLRQAFASPEALSKIELISTRAFTELEGVTAAMDQQLSRILANGLAQGSSPATMAREMSKSIGALSRTRAEVIARTETISAHAEGQLDAFDRLGVEEVGIEAEWMTAGDERVCPLCGELDGVVMPIDDARGLIPRHPNCRCSWSPASKFQKQPGQLWGKEGKDAIGRSIGAERKKGTFAEKLSKSPWLGKTRLAAKLKAPPPAASFVPTEQSNGSGR